MYRKQIVYVAMVSMKFFFNLDHYIVDQIFLIAFLSIASFKSVIGQVVKQMAEQLHRMKGYVIALKNHLQHEQEVQGYSLLHLNRFKQHYPDKKFWGVFNNGK